LLTENFAFVRQHRGGHNRPGIAVLMVYLRYPGRVLGPAEKPHAPIIGIVAAQLGVTPAVWDVYAARDETRREHLQELLARLGLVPFSRQHYRALVGLLLPVPMQTTQDIVLAQAAVDELRRRHVLLPPFLRSKSDARPWPHASSTYSRKMTRDASTIGLSEPFLKPRM
jgi:TnpA family transposase